MKFLKMNDEARKNVETYFKQQYQNQDKGDKSQD
jgi:hypothetical protein